MGRQTAIGFLLDHAFGEGPNQGMPAPRSCKPSWHSFFYSPHLWVTGDVSVSDAGWRRLPAGWLEGTDRARTLDAQREALEYAEVIVQVGALDERRREVEGDGQVH